MISKDWQSLSLDAFDAEPDQLVHTVRGDTPCHTVDMNALHEMFHEQTKYHRATSLGLAQNIRAYIEQPALIARCVMSRDRRGLSGKALPDPEALTGTLEAALVNRKSTRRQDLQGPISLCTLSTLLHHSARAQRSAAPKAAPSLTQHYRPYPSAGALYPCDIYVMASAIDGLEAGVYRYDSVHHDLVGCSHPQAIESDFSSVESGSWPVPACAIVITAVPQRSVRKYGLRGYRFSMMEAGHILQNLSLVATNLELVSLISASFYEAELEALIKVDGVSEVALASFMIGGD